MLFSALLTAHPRLFGVAFCLFGAWSIYESLVVPLQKATVPVAEISIRPAGPAFGLVLLLIGSAYVLFGTRLTWVFHPSAEQSRLPALLVGVVIAIIGLSVYFWLDARLKQQGYVNDRKVDDFGKKMNLRIEELENNLKTMQGTPSNRARP